MENNQKNRMEEDTMATATKPLNHAFVLKSDKKYISSQLNT